MKKSIEKQKSLVMNVIKQAVDIIDNEQRRYSSKTGNEKMDKDEYLLSLYFEVKNLSKYFPVIESYMDKKYKINKNELVLAAVLKKIGFCLERSEYTTDMTYGLLTGGITYVDILERNII